MKKVILLTIALIVFCIAVCSCNNSLKDLEDDLEVNIPIIPKYTVTYQTNGGQYLDSEKTDRINSAPITYKEDHELAGWYLDSNCELPAVFPLEIEKDTVLYAKWLRVRIEKPARNFSIKMWSGSNPSATFDITPNSFDFDEIEERGYYIKVTVTYDVYYKKDYTLPFGYAGSPKYEVTLLDESLVGFQEKDLTTSTSTKTKTHSWVQTPGYFENEDFTLTFSTDNIQNTIYFKNITIKYECVKAR